MLITTPESLFLLLTSKARESLAGVETVILDEVHAVAGTKRGAHLALSLERLDALLERPAQRVGLSATVRPVEEVARFLAGGRPVTVVQPPSTKEWDLEVVVPIADMSALGEVTGDLSGPAAGAERRASIWPHVEERIVDLIAGHRSTLVFSNSRRLAERLTARLNEIWEERLAVAAAGREDASADEQDAVRRPRRPGAHAGELMAQAGTSHGAAPVLARAHHGSVSKEQRGLIEDELKAGRLPAVVATSSLELGIDMGAIDLVIQVESPPSVASGLQRVGRAGHQVGAVSRGVVFPKFRGDLVQTAVVVDRMRAGAIESLHVPANPVDVLAQQVVAMCALDDWDVDELESLVRRATPFATLPRSDPRVGARHALRPLPERRVRRAAAADRLGPAGQHPHRPARCAAPGRDQRRHDPRPGALRRVPRHRRGVGPAGRRARRGDGLRVPCRRRVHPRLVVVADRGHHPRPGPGHAGTGTARQAAVLARRRAGPAGRAGPCRGRVRPRAGGPQARGGPRARRAPPAWTSGLPTT